jgi:hypothetical protein
MLIYILISVATCFLVCPYLKKFIHLKRWRYIHKLSKHQPIFQNIIKDIDGFKLSQIARTSADAMEYSYGEIEFVSFIALISLARPTLEGRFYDLGSGSGKAVLACAMVFDMQTYCGIELFEELHHAALLLQQRLQQHPGYQHKIIHFIHDNFLNADFSDASLIFINATALFGATWEQLNQRLDHEAAAGTVIITISKALTTSTRYTLNIKTSVLMSWGVATAYIQEKL